MKRILLKLSGEALAGEKGAGLDGTIITRIGEQVVELTQSPRFAGNEIQLGIVIGGGNFWRGCSNQNIDRTKSDQLGMLATVMNCIYVSEIFRNLGLKTRIFTPFACSTFTELFSKDRANESFGNGEVVFFAGGTGHPYFSTDTGAVLRAIETEADVILLAKNIDGVYDSDPKTNPQAKKYREISLNEVITQNLGVIDLTAAVMARDHKMPLMVFALSEKGSIIKAALNDTIGTRITV